MKQTVGQQGEDIIAASIRKNGWKILERNLHSRFGEIDIIAHDGDEIVFIEVKMRTNTLFGHPAEAVTRHKMRKMMKTAQWYLVQHHCEHAPYRFDVFSILQEHGTMEVEHYKNVC